MAKRMARPASSAAAPAQDLAFARLADGDHVGHLGLALGERAGLVEGDGGDLAEGLQHGAALDAAARAGRPPTGPRRWRPGSR